MGGEKERDDCESEGEGGRGYVSEEIERARERER